jgi:predicted TPR repeat methyltransferase
MPPVKAKKKTIRAKKKTARRPAAAKPLSARAIAREVRDLCAKAEAARAENDQKASRGFLEKALKLDPACSDAIWWMGDYWHTVGKREPAIRFYRRYLREHPGDAEAVHMIASLGGRTPPKRASDDYLRLHFDSYAEDFDKSLVGELEYQAPKVLRKLIDRVRGARAPKADVCDIGCGTGLVGLELKSLARTLTGVDLSRKMVSLSRKRGIYDRLSVGEVTTFLRANRGRFDLIVAADVLIYFGDITELFAAAADALRPGGLFAFTVESRRGGTYHLTVSGRYTHNPVWLRKVGAAAGLRERRTLKARLRYEMAKPVMGHYAVMEKQA